MRLSPRIITAVSIIVLAFLVGRFASGLKLATILQRTTAPAVDGTIAVSAVVDGDTIELEGGTRVRLIGVNTPETVDPRRPVQCFGKEASAYTHSLLEGKRVRLVKDVSETDKFGRLLRYVYMEDGTFVNLELVLAGYAQASAYPPDVAHQKEFEAAQAQAREAGLGLWGDCGGIRAQSAAPLATIVAPNGSCSIKGNISSGGHIYHLSGCPYYEKTRIDEGAGEHWFCTEAEAEAAGWRRASNCP